MRAAFGGKVPAMKRTDPHDVLYRLYRLRRQIAVLGLLPLAGTVLGALCAPSGAVFGTGAWIAGLPLLWSAAVAALSVRFPAGWSDLVAMSLAVTGLAALAPAIAALLGGLLDAGQPVLFLASLLGLLLGTLAAVLALVVLQIGLLAGRPLGLRRYGIRTRVPLPAEPLRAAAFLKPGRTYPNRETGPADADGVFEVVSRFRVPAEGCFDPDDVEIRFRARILEEGPDSQTTLFFIGEGAAATTSVQRLTIREDGGRTLYDHEEIHDHFDLYAGLGWWLTDAGGDGLTELLDSVSGRPVRALRRMPQGTPLGWLAGWMMRRGLAEGG